MAKKICNYFILQLKLSSLLLLLIAVPAFAQNKQKTETESVEKIPLYNGLKVGVDLYGLGSKALGSDFLSNEVSVSASLKKRFYPIVELGFGSTNTRSDMDTHYKSSAPYFRLGLDYNTMPNKEKGFLYVGARYGFSSFSFDVEGAQTEDGLGNPNLKDEIWHVYPSPFSHKGLKSNMQWFELVVGVEVQVYKEFHMGWSLRMKYRIKASASDYGDPWYVPGFGKYDSSATGITYSLIYKLPL
ncbi:DUF6048 family protein [Bacteroides sp. OttesenSCG-928-J23]|nr:DUF6048 family protein [Bacteroides sp. OttesenSCG-928-N06]MDL2247853.1 DUF6048 family protein [Bacteroides sp. OttesenSCG-928-J23]